ncbi:MAG: 5-formyltetrahydrofolate cyclo-ligase, partial [Sphingomonas sp.]
MTDKRATRARLRALRDGFARGGAIGVPLALVERFGRGIVVASYVAVGSEADPAPIAAAARAAGCTIALPHVVGRAAPLRFLRADGPLEAGPF